MNILDFRAEVTDLFRKTFRNRANLRLEFENGAMVDRDTSTVAILRMDIVYLSAEQRDLSERPWVTEHGDLRFALAFKDGSGTLLMNQTIMEIQKAFERKYMAWGKTYTGTRTPPVVLDKGWVVYRFNVPFSVDLISE